MKISYFANKLAQALLDDSSSHAFYFMQRAFSGDYHDDMQWPDVEALLIEIIGTTEEGSEGSEG